MDSKEYWREHRDHERGPAIPKAKHVPQLQCDVCQKKFPKENQMKQHRKAAHGKGSA